MTYWDSLSLEFFFNFLVKSINFFFTVYALWSRTNTSTVERTQNTNSQHDLLLSKGNDDSEGFYFRLLFAFFTKFSSSLACRSFAQFQECVCLWYVVAVMALVELSCLFTFNNNYGCVRLNTVIESDEVGKDKF